MINANDIEYIMLKLDSTSKLKLMQLVNDYFGNRYTKIYCDHITLAYGMEQVSKFDQSLFGRKVKLDANTIVYDDKAAALVINRADVEKYGINNKYPHVTLATAHSTKPVYSNELLSNFNTDIGSTSQFVLDEHIQLRFTIVPQIRKDKYMI